MDSLSLSVDGSMGESIAGLNTSLGSGFIESPNYFLTTPGASSLSLTGNVTFDWVDGVAARDLQGERFKFSFKVLEGNVIPSPAGAGLLALGGLIAARRRR